MLEPFREVGTNFSLQLSLQTQFAKIKNKKVITENQCEKHKKSSLVTCQKDLYNRADTDLYFSGFLWGLKSCALISHDYLSQSKFLLLPRGRAAMCWRPASKYQKKICFVSKKVCTIAYEVRISCKLPISVTLYVFCYLENQFSVTD